MGNFRTPELRNQFEKALASPILTDESSINCLVRDQLFHSSSIRFPEHVMEAVVQRRSSELSNFLEMLRSVSESGISTKMSSYKDWKLKQDNDQLRVMYREGPQGSPFHTLLVEGYVDGPVDACLCVSWESALYHKWWPQFTVPPFKIMSSNSLLKVGIGEEISLVRVKVPWPISSREALLHFFEIECFDEGLILALVNTLSDAEDLHIRACGLAADKIPEPTDIIRIGLVGGFAIQKVNPKKSYFRTIMTMDFKVDFIPPALINFISRQLIGSGFKLYQKAVASASHGDEDFSLALQRKPMYIRVREGLEIPNRNRNNSKATHSGKLLGTLEYREHITERPRWNTSNVNDNVIINNLPFKMDIAEMTKSKVSTEENQHMSCSPTDIVSGENETNQESCSGHQVEHAEVILDKATIFFEKDNCLNGEPPSKHGAATGSSSSSSSSDCYFDARSSMCVDGEDHLSREYSRHFAVNNIRYSMASASSSREPYSNARNRIDMVDVDDLRHEAERTFSPRVRLAEGHCSLHEELNDISVSHVPNHLFPVMGEAQTTLGDEVGHTADTHSSSVKRLNGVQLEVDASHKAYSTNNSKKLKKTRKLRLCCLS